MRRMIRMIKERTKSQMRKKHRMKTFRNKTNGQMRTAQDAFPQRCQPRCSGCIEVAGQLQLRQIQNMSESERAADQSSFV